MAEKQRCVVPTGDVVVEGTVETHWKNMTGCDGATSRSSTICSGDGVNLGATEISTRQEPHYPKATSAPNQTIVAGARLLVPLIAPAPPGYNTAALKQQQQQTGPILPMPSADNTAASKHLYSHYQVFKHLPASPALSPDREASIIHPLFRGKKARSGKWLEEEEAYADLVVRLFDQGDLADCTHGMTLRAYLSQKLYCAPMRISKKYAGKGIGKLVYNCKKRYISLPVVDRDALLAKLKQAEDKFVQAALLNVDQPPFDPCFIRMLHAGGQAPVILPHIPHPSLLPRLPVQSTVDILPRPNVLPYVNSSNARSTTFPPFPHSSMQHTQAPANGQLIPSDDFSQLSSPASVSPLRTASSDQVVSSVTHIGVRGYSARSSIAKSGTGMVQHPFATMSFDCNRTTFDPSTTLHTDGSNNSGSQIQHLTTTVVVSSNGEYKHCGDLTRSCDELAIGAYDLINSQVDSATQHYAPEVTSSLHQLSKNYEKSFQNKAVVPNYCNITDRTVLATDCNGDHVPDFLSGFDRVSLKSMGFTKESDASTKLNATLQTALELDCPFSPTYTSQSFDDLHRFLGKGLSPVDKLQNEITWHDPSIEPSFADVGAPDLFSAESYALFAKEAAVMNNDHAASLALSAFNHESKNSGSSETLPISRIRLQPLYKSKKSWLATDLSGDYTNLHETSATHFTSPLKGFDENAWHNLVSSSETSSASAASESASALESAYDTSDEAYGLNYNTSCKLDKRQGEFDVSFVEGPVYKKVKSE